MTLCVAPAQPLDCGHLPAQHLAAVLCCTVLYCTVICQHNTTHRKHPFCKQRWASQRRYSLHMYVYGYSVGDSNCWGSSYTLDEHRLVRLCTVLHLSLYTVHSTAPLFPINPHIMTIMIIVQLWRPDSQHWAGYGHSPLDLLTYDVTSPSISGVFDYHYV